MSVPSSGAAFDLRVVLGDPARVNTIPRELLPAVLAHASSVMSALAAVAAEQAHVPSAAADDEDRLLTLEEAARVANVTVRWLRRHRGLPVFVSLSLKNLRVSEKRLRRSRRFRRGCRNTCFIPCSSTARFATAPGRWSASSGCRERREGGR